VRAKNKDKRWDVVITPADGKQAYLEKVTVEDLKKLVGLGD
jgi:hypothetical protein